MPEDQKPTNQTPTPAQPQAPSADDFIKEINRLKETTVPKEELQKYKDENAKLIKTLANGGSISEEQAKEAKMTSEDYAKELIKPHTNLEYAKLSLKQREKAIEEGKPDPYMPQGENFTEGRSTDAENAQRAADFLQSLVDDSDDNPQVFNSLLQARLKDDPAVVMAISARKANQKA